MSESKLPPVRAPRFARLIKARCVVEGGLTGSLLIKNISETGIGAKCEEDFLRRGQEVQLWLPHEHTVRGVVRWLRGQNCGIEAFEPIDLESLRFNGGGNLLTAPMPFSVEPRYQTVERLYRPGVRTR